MFIQFAEVRKTLEGVLLKNGFNEAKAELIAKVVAESSLDGVYSHGLNRFPRFIETVKKGFVKIDAEPVLELVSGAVERWNGNLGSGITNATFSMNRAMELAKIHGIGAVGLRNTNHWLRGGSYGKMAIDNNCIGICFTNTKPNMPPWGGSIPKLGNNPFVVGIPHKQNPILLDMSMSQYSFGKLSIYANNNEQLPYAGGFDNSDKLTTDAGVILENERTLPVGLWKGSGLSLVLDILSLILSGGDPALKIGERDEEYGLSQVFIAIDTKTLSNEHIDSWIQKIQVDLGEESDSISYPGEQTRHRRLKNTKDGIPVEKIIWEEILNS